ncbi:MAG: BrnA antitoxin family protein [Sphingomonadaceae bacterium]
MKSKIVRYTLDSLPPRTPEEEARLDALFARPDSEIDLSDMPEWTKEDFKNAVRGDLYRPLKEQVTAKVDQDVVAWLKSGGPGYQTRMNAILRGAMLAALAKKDEAKAA